MRMNPKKRAADNAVEYIKDGMIIGLGTGSTAYWAIRQIAAKIQEGLRVKAVASSERSEGLAKQMGIPLVSFAEIGSIDITIDGADEVDSQLNLIKGGGGALLREKVLAFHSKSFVVIIDESKRVERLGRIPLPVEIIPFASNLTLGKLGELGCHASIRRVGERHYMTDNGNLIADCSFETIEDPAVLSSMIHAIPGVVEHGLFLSPMVDVVVVGKQEDAVRMYPLTSLS